jgi:ANTAR domain
LSGATSTVSRARLRSRLGDPRSLPAPPCPGLRGAHSGALAGQLQVALDARGLIERAKGALMERERLDEQEAFAHLRRAARPSGRKLSDVAREVSARQRLPRGGQATPTQTEQPNRELDILNQTPEVESAVDYRSCSPCHPIMCRMRLDHPDDHPDDRSVSVWSRLDRRGSQREQARSVWSLLDRRRASGSYSEGRRFESDLGLQNRSSEALSGVADGAAARVGHSFGFGSRVAGAPDALRWSRCAARFPAGLSLGPESGWVYGQAPSRVRLGGVASGVTRKRHSTLGRAEFLVDDLQRSFHRVGTEATDAVVEWMVEELQEEQHRHDHRDHGPHE